MTIEEPEPDNTDEILDDKDLMIQIKQGKRKGAKSRDFDEVVKELDNKPKKSTTPQCPECGKRHNYYRRTTGEYVCQQCGNTWKKEEESG